MLSSMDSKVIQWFALWRWRCRVVRLVECVAVDMYEGRYEDV